MEWSLEFWVCIENSEYGARVHILKSMVALFNKQFYCA